MRLEGVTRTKPAKKNLRSPELMQAALQNPTLVIRELNNRSLYHFIQYFWGTYSSATFSPNWHIEYICKEIEQAAGRVAGRLAKQNDIIINVPPGTTKSATVSIFFPIWCWTKWPWMRFITASYSGPLALELADYSREVIRSQEFQRIYPDLVIKDDKDTKSNFRIVKKEYYAAGRAPKFTSGGNRFSTSVGGTLMGFHGDIIIVDDPLNPQQAASESMLLEANRWMEQTLPTRKTDKRVSLTILIMQRLHQNDPAGAWLEKQKESIKHICLPGEIRNYQTKLSPPELSSFYKNDLLDVNRLDWVALKELEERLGQYGYAGQIGQNPIPPGGGMFKVDHLQYTTGLPEKTKLIHAIRYWDKAATKDAGAYTAGVKIGKLSNGKYIIMDVKRGQWATHERENIILETAEADGHSVEIWIEQEPGSGGKESAEASVRNLAGFRVKTERPTGQKEDRADPFSVQVNHGNVYIMNGTWVPKYIDELRNFPFSTYKDQVDASGAGFNKLVAKRIAGRIT